MSRSVRLHYIEYLFLYLFERIFHPDHYFLHFRMIAFRAECVDFTTHFLGYETELFALSGRRFLFFLEVVEVLYTTLFFFVYVDILDITFLFLFFSYYYLFS